MKNEINQTFIKKILDYDPISGSFTWKERGAESFQHSPEPIKSRNIFNGQFCGKKAGSELTSKRSKTSYIAIKINGKSYKAHRLAFLFMEGFIPEEVDHIDHNGVNNSWINLRASNKNDNAKNHPIQHNNKTGMAGVNWHKSAKKWQVRANNNGKRVDLGRYSTLEEAIKVRKDYEVKFKYYENRGEI